MIFRLIQIQMYFFLNSINFILVSFYIVKKTNFNFGEIKNNSGFGQHCKVKSD
jgi:hypothetical protein